MIYPLIWLGKAAQHLSKNSKVAAFGAGFVAWITGFIDGLITATIEQLYHFFQNIITDQFTDITLTTIDYIAYANAVLPLSEFVVLMGIYVTAWVTVICIRWVKSFVPTVAN